MDVVVGIDTYGRVKTVRGTSIVTKFAMIKSMPVYPLQSLYVAFASQSETRGDLSTPILIAPLARVDGGSVAMAYARGVFAAMTVVGFLAIVPLIIQFTGEQLDDLGLLALRVLISSFIIGAVCGLLTYLIPLTTRRERRIRSCCGELLQINADPARVSADTSVVIEEFAARVAPKSIQEDSRISLLLRLIETRARISRGLDVNEMERETDELLDRIDRE